TARLRCHHRDDRAASRLRQLVCAQQRLQACPRHQPATSPRTHNRIAPARNSYTRAMFVLVVSIGTWGTSSDGGAVRGGGVAAHGLCATTPSRRVMIGSLWTARPCG